MKVFVTLVFISLTIFTHHAFSQRADSIKSINHFGGTVTVTNNGISFVPTFSLGKPAAIFDMIVGKNKLSFEPQLRFALTGKPWSFVFWWRYKLITKDRFFINVGMHPSVVFRHKTFINNGVTNEVLATERYLATEISPNYRITKNITIGMYYLHSNGLDKGITRNTHFLTINANFLHVKLSKQYYMKFNPQLFYLKMDAKDGFYATTTTTLARRNFPLSIQSIINQAIETDIVTKSDFVWNVSVVYSFRNEYVKK